MSFINAVIGYIGKKGTCMLNKFIQKINNLEETLFEYAEQNSYLFSQKN